MSYVQIDIGGKKRGWKYNKIAEREFQKKVIPKNDMSALCGLVYGGLFANCYVKSEDPDFTFEDVCDWCESISIENATAITDAFKETETYKNTDAYRKELEALKKKVPVKNSPGKRSMVKS